MGTKRFATLVRFGWRANLVCVRPEVSSDRGGGQCRAGGTRAGDTVAVLQYSVPDRSMACASACTCACTSTSNHEKGLVCTLDARKDQTHVAHRPTGSICGDNQTASAGSLPFDLLPCGSCGGSGLETRDSRACCSRCHGTGAFTTAVSRSSRATRCRALGARANFAIGLFYGYESPQGAT